MKDKLRCVIVDDDLAAHDALLCHIAKVNWLEHAGSYLNAVEAVEAIEIFKPDFVFLDVNMPVLSGVELLTTLSVHRPQVIMTTGSPSYTIDGFMNDVTAFLLKPVSFNHFLKAVNKVRFWCKAVEVIAQYAALPPGVASTTAPGVQPVPVPRAGYDARPVVAETPCATPAIDFKDPNGADGEYLWIRADRKLTRVRYEDIFYVEGLKDYVKIYHRDGVLITHGSVSAMEMQLKKNFFLRVHRSYVVNCKAIRHIEGNVIIMENNLKATMAASKRDVMLRHITGENALPVKNAASVE